MEINLQQAVVKSANGGELGKSINFDQLKQFIEIWDAEIGGKLREARCEISLWRNGNHSINQIKDVLEAIIVKFGEGQQFVWPRVKNFLDENLQQANEAIITVDQNIQNRSEFLFETLRQIKGLGRVSYGSKVLRCLSDDYVVLDKLLMSKLGEQDYWMFRQKCSSIAQALNPNYKASHVEGGLFAWLQILNPNQRRHRWKQYSNQIAA